MVVGSHMITPALLSFIQGYKVVSELTYEYGELKRDESIPKHMAQKKKLMWEELKSVIVEERVNLPFGSKSQTGTSLSPKRIASLSPKRIAEVMMRRIELWELSGKSQKIPGHTWYGLFKGAVQRAVRIIRVVEWANTLIKLPIILEKKRHCHYIPESRYDYLLIWKWRAQET